MSASSDDFEEYLAADESIVDVAPGRFVEETTRPDGAIGLTDRRVLFVSGDTGFTDVRYDKISSIRSWPRRRLTRRGLGARVLAVAGILLAAAAVSALVFLASSPFEALLAVVAVVAFVVAGLARRTGVDIDWTALRSAVEDADPGSLNRGIQQRWKTDYVYAHQFALLAGTLLGVLAVAGLVLVAGDPLPFALVLAALAGLAATDFGVGRIRQLDRTGEGWRTEQDLTIELVGGQEVTLRIESTEQIERTLCRVSTPNAPHRHRNHDRADPGSPHQ